MDRMVENSLILPTIIQVKNSDDSTDYYIIDGNILKKSNKCVLVEGTTLWKKSSEGEYTPSLLYHKTDGTRPYVVIVFGKHHASLVKHYEYDARFFDNFIDAQRYYSCFTSIETEKKAYAKT
jgi:hypothetical protein